MGGGGEGFAEIVDDGFRPAFEDEVADDADIGIRRRVIAISLVRSHSNAFASAHRGGEYQRAPDFRMSGFQSQSRRTGISGTSAAGIG